MNLSLNIILEWLSDFEPIHDEFTDLSKSFNKCCILGSKRQDNQALLLLSEYADVEKYIASLHEDDVLICTGANGTGPSSVGFICDTIILDTCDSIGSVFNHLNDCFFRSMKWDYDMKHIISTNAGLQALLDVSEEFFVNPILLITISLIIPACTKNIPCDDPDIQYAQVHHTYSANMISTLIKDNYIVEPGTYDELTYIDSKYHDCDVLVRTFPENLMQLKAIFQFNLNQPPTAAEKDLMKILSDAVETYVTGSGSDSTVPFDTAVYDSILAGVIEGNAQQDEIDAYKLLMQVSDTSFFRIIVIYGRKILKTQLFYLIRLVNSYYPSMRKFIYKNHVVLLDRIDEIDSDRDKSIIAFIETMLINNEAYCGTTCFTGLENLRFAFTMADAAVRIGSLIAPSKIIYSYKDYSTYHYLLSAGEKIPLEFLYDSKLEKVVDYDHEHNTDNLELLRVFLECERSYTKTSERLHLHRNSVYYRIAKIEELIGTSLADSEERLRLMLSLKIKELLSHGISERLIIQSPLS